jgi:hypothetical protein
LVVGNLRLANATGESFYQTIEPDFFGVGLVFGDFDSAVANAADLLAPGLDGTAVEIYVIDTTP